MDIFRIVLFTYEIRKVFFSEKLRNFCQESDKSATISLKFDSCSKRADLPKGRFGRCCQAGLFECCTSDVFPGNDPAPHPDKTSMMKRFLLSCKAATELMEKRLRKELTIGERFRLFLHTAMCDACRLYARQTTLLEKLFKARHQADPGPGEDAGIEELQKKILKHLEKKN